MWTALIAGAAAGLASVPHCTAMCGPLAAYACSGSRGAGAHARYQIGRFISYTAVGALVGTLGGAAAVSLPGEWGRALLSWSLAVGLGLAALRLWRRPAPAPSALVALRKKDERANTTGGWVEALGRHPFLVGLGTAFLPCGALAAAVLIAASTGTALLGALSMLAFSVVSGVGLIAASWLFDRLARRPGSASQRTLAVVLGLGAIIFVLRPVHALQHDVGEHAHTVHEHASPP